MQAQGDGISLLMAHSAICSASSVEQVEHVTGCNFLAFKR